MPELPAVCRTCATVFGSGISIAGGWGTLSGNTAGPCPSCGDVGDVPDGIYSVLGNTIDYLASGSNAAAAMQRVIDVLQGARERQASTSETIAALREEIPDAPAGLWAFLDSSKGRGIVALLMLLLAAVAAAQPYLKHDEPGIAPRDVERIVETAVTQAITKVRVSSPQPPASVHAARPPQAPHIESDGARRKAEQVRKKKRGDARRARRRNR